MRTQPEREILVFQTMDFDPLTGTESPRDPVPLSSDFSLKPLHSKFFTLYDFVRISEVVSINLQEEVPIPLPEGKSNSTLPCSAAHPILARSAPLAQISGKFGLAEP